MVWGVVTAMLFVALISGWPRILAAVSGAGMIAVLLLETLTPGSPGRPTTR